MSMRTALASGLAAAAVLAATSSAALGVASTAGAQVASLGADTAYVVTYRNGSRRLVLARLSPEVELTRITPGHDRVRISVQEWASRWKRMYGKAGPNAVLTYGTGARAQRVSWNLASARYDTKRAELTFLVRPLAKGSRRALPVVPTGVHRKKVTRKALGPATLFID